MKHVWSRYSQALWQFVRRKCAYTHSHLLQTLPDWRSSYVPGDLQRKANFAQAVNWIHIRLTTHVHTMESSLNSNFYIIEPDRPQHGRPAACYRPAVFFFSFVSLRFYSYKEKYYIIFKNHIVSDFDFLKIPSVWNCVTVAECLYRQIFQHHQKHAARQEFLTTRWHPHTWPLLIWSKEHHPPHIYQGSNAGKATLSQEHLRPWTSPSKYEFQISFEMTATVAPKSISIVGVWRGRRGS